MAACFIAGAAGDWEDEEYERGELGAGTLSTIDDQEETMNFR